MGVRGIIARAVASTAAALVLGAAGAVAATVQVREELKGTTVDLQITPSNCVQCGAITAKGGRLTPPEGGDGPNYQQT